MLNHPAATFLDTAREIVTPAARPISPLRAQAEQIVSRRVDRDRYPEIFAADVRVTMGWLSSAAENARIEAARKTYGHNKDAMLAALLGGAA